MKVFSSKEPVTSASADVASGQCPAFSTKIKDRNDQYKGLIIKTSFIHSHLKKWGRGEEREARGGGWGGGSHTHSM